MRSARRSSASRRPAIAQQRVEGARAVAIADQREAEAAVTAGAVHLAREQFRLLGRRVGASADGKGLGPLSPTSPPTGPNLRSGGQVLGARATRQLAATTRCASTVCSAPCGARAREGLGPLSPTGPGAPLARLAAARAGDRQMSMGMSSNGEGGDRPVRSVYAITGIKSNAKGFWSAEPRQGFVNLGRVRLCLPGPCDRGNLCPRQERAAGCGGGCDADGGDGGPGGSSESRRIWPELSSDRESVRLVSEYRPIAVRFHPFAVRCHEPARSAARSITRMTPPVAGPPHRPSCWRFEPGKEP